MVSGTSRDSFHRYSSPLAMTVEGMVAPMTKWIVVRRWTNRSPAMPAQ